MTNTCIFCGCSLEGKDRRAKYCSNKCQNGQRHVDSVARNQRECKQCGAMFVPWSGGSRTRGSGSYCSKKCFWTWIAKHDPPMINGYKKGAKCAAYSKTCEYCGVQFISRCKSKRSFCCNDHRKEQKLKEYYDNRDSILKQKRDKYEPKPKERRRCVICGKIFMTSKRTEKTCSLKCSKKNVRLNKPNSDRARARKFGVDYEYVNPMKVFRRDGWICQICGKSTPKRNRGTRYSNAPELDHRVPMSKGGGHLYTNVQCACHRCNAQKSNNDCRGQLPIFEIKTKPYGGTAHLDGNQDAGNLVWSHA